MNNHKLLFFIIYLSIIFSFLLFINLYYLEGIPHVPDEVAYLFMAKMFSLGHVIMPIPTSPEHFNFFPGILSVEKGMWLFQYPFGHPLLLTVGVFLGFPNLIPPLIGTLSILFLFLIIKKVYGLKTAYFLLPLPFLSPFFLENAASFMSHNTAVFYLVLSIYCVIRSLNSKHSILFILVSGICLGLLFNTRPLTSLSFLLLIIGIIVYKYQKKLSMLLWFLLGFCFLFILWLGYNSLTIGDMFQSSYYSVNKGLLPFENHEPISHFFSSRLENTKILFKNLGPMLFNWPSIITYGLLFVPFLAKKNTFWDNIFFLSLFSLPFAYFFYNGTFLMYGPRFWYEILPFIFILTARSFSVLYSYKAKSTLALFTLLATFSFLKLFAFIPTQDPDYFSLVSLPKLKGFNFTDARIKNEVKIKNIHNAVIFVKDCNGNWWCYGSVFSQNSPTLNTSIVYVKDLGEQNNIIREYFPAKSAYTIDYNTLELIKLR